MAPRPMAMIKLFVFFSTSSIIFTNIFELGKCSDVDPDEECFQDDKSIPIGRPPAHNKTALVKITEYVEEQFMGGMIYSDKSKTQKQLNGGEIVLTKYTYNGVDALEDFNPRSLRIYFDGIDVYAGIALLKEQIVVANLTASQSWGPCQKMKAEDGSKTLTYYRYKEIKKTGNILLRWRKLDIETIFDAPLGPDYDSECAQRGGAEIWASPGSTRLRRGRSVKKEKKKEKKKVVIHHIQRFQYPDRTSDLKMSETTFVITEDSTHSAPTVREFNPLTAIGPSPPFDAFPGGAVKPRNLSLWLDAEGRVQMATAFLQQKKWYLENRIYEDEKWTCARVVRTKGDDDDEAILEAPFSEYHVKNSKFELGNFQIKQDRFKIFVTNRASGCDFFTTSLSCLCLYFVAIAAWVLV